MRKCVIAAIGSLIFLGGCNSGNQSVVGSLIDGNDLAGTCQRDDVADMVGKEARSLILQSATQTYQSQWLYGSLKLSQLGTFLDSAQVKFADVGVAPANTETTAPFRQIICNGSMQIDGSNAAEGQQVITLPHLRWSVNFADPTSTPLTSAFTIAVDPISISDGLLFNGAPPSANGNDAPVAQGDGNAGNPVGGEQDADPVEKDAAAAARDAMMPDPAHDAGEAPAAPTAPHQ